MTKAPTQAENPAAIDAAGVDLTLIEWFQTLSPTERLKTLQNYLESIEKLRACAAQNADDE